MKKLVWGSFLLMALGVVGASAQVSVEVRLEQEQYLRGEAVPVAVRITNRSGQMLKLGAEEDWLTFSVTTPQTGSVPRLSEPPVVGEFELGSSQVGTKRVNLAPHFDFERPGTYTITAKLKIKQWGAETASASKSFTVIEGARIWEQEIGVPGKTSATGPEMRRYILHQANYLKNQLRLYLRVTDANDLKTIKVTPVGRMLSFSRPEAQVDKDSSLHLLYQSGAHVFSYNVFTTDGDLVRRESYEYQTSRPRLQVDLESMVMVKGGVRRVSASDVPPPPKEGEPGETAAKADAAVTNAAATVPPLKE